MPRTTVLTLVSGLAIAFVGASAGPAFATDEMRAGDTNVCVDDDDHDQARVARENEVVLPLVDILLALENRLGGVLIEIEFECEDGLYVYEFAVRTPEGRIIEWLVDATTGEIIIEDD